MGEDGCGEDGLANGLRGCFESGDPDSLGGENGRDVDWDVDRTVNCVMVDCVTVDEVDVVGWDEAVLEVTTGSDVA